MIIFKITKTIIEIINLDPKKTDRITFNQITESALKDAINNPGRLNQNLYNAQKARSILDIVYGFTMLCLTNGTVVSLTDYWAFGLVLYIVLCMLIYFGKGYS